MLPELSIGLVVFLLGVGVYTVAAAVWDIRVKKIPNKLTLPFFGLGIVYQLAFHGWAGLAEGGLGFALGFGLLFLMWMIGSGGGGDVKLMGGLAMWLGFKLTVMVLVGSMFVAIVGTMMVIVSSMFNRGLYNTKDKYLVAGKLKPGEKPKKETIEQRTNRRPMGYAVPVALATWTVVVWQLPQFPWIGGKLLAGLM
ncbi:MAG: A24 family peptidase [Planctomycetota bacterium]|nr:A24 family peptidase [Planctomycetota bacterium]